MATRPNPEYNAGAREERRATIKRLLRRLKPYIMPDNQYDKGYLALQGELDWQMARARRCGDDLGGLGRK